MREGPMATKLALILVAVLFYSEPALANCAWVLWMKDGYTSINRNPWRRLLREVGLSSRKAVDSTTSWEIAAAYPRYAECEQALKGKWEYLQQSFSGFDKSTLNIKDIEQKLHRSVAARFKDGDSWTVSVFCLPDTIDPRISK